MYTSFTLKKNVTINFFWAKLCNLPENWVRAFKDGDNKFTEQIVLEYDCNI